MLGLIKKLLPSNKPKKKIILLDVSTLESDEKMLKESLVTVMLEHEKKIEQLRNLPPHQLIYSREKIIEVMDLQMELIKRLIRIRLGEINDFRMALGNKSRLRS